MDVTLITARVVHLAAQLSLMGIVAFVPLVATPSYARSGATMPQGLLRRLRTLAWISLGLALLAGIAWLVFVAASMSAEPLRAVFAQGAVATVLTDTQFGRVWILRMILLALLAPFAAALGRRRAMDAAGASIAAALVAATAWQGHAGAEEGLNGILHGGADALHLVAAGGWLGSLAPLALLLAQSRRDGNRRGIGVARAAAIAFSDLGLGCVAALLVTGAINAWFLVGTIGALLGTLYGQLLLLKLVLFAAMVSLAASNRLRLLPRLATTDHGRKANESRRAFAAIERNAMLESAMGVLVIAIAGTLGTLVPGAHQQPWWPFAYRLGLDAIEAAPALRNDAIGTASIAAIGLVLLVFGWRRRHVLAIAIGIFFIVALGWRPIQLMLIDATPTSYYASPQRFALGSILAGRALYAQNCVSCHGADGHGDGPLAKEQPIPPADLTAHLFAHTDGDLFWFISRGMENGAMPSFAATLDETQRWDLINFLKSRAGGVEDAAMSAEVTADPAPVAPDFSLAAVVGAATTLKSLLDQDAVLLAFDANPTSPRGAQLEEWRSVLAESGVYIVAIADDPELRSVYALYDTAGAPLTAPVEFLIDHQGYIRARWHPGDVPDWQNLDALTREIAAMARLKFAPVVQVHVH